MDSPEKIAKKRDELYKELIKEKLFEVEPIIENFIAPTYNKESDSLVCYVQEDITVKVHSAVTMRLGFKLHLPDGFFPFIGGLDYYIKQRDEPKNYCSSKELIYSGDHFFKRETHFRRGQIICAVYFAVDDDTEKAEKGIREWKAKEWLEI